MNTQKQQKKRRDQVLTNMYTHDKITKEEMTEAQKNIYHYRTSLEKRS